MSNLMAWLALPLFLAPVLFRRDRFGASAGQSIVAGLCLAALHQGAGTLDPGELRTIVAQSAHDAWFVGITAGALLSGAWLLPRWRNLRDAVPGGALALVM